MTFSFRFDTQDVVFLSQVKQAIQLNRVTSRDASFTYADALYPNGIIDMAIPAEMRMATAVLRLLDSLDQGQEEERIRALRALRDEVMVSARSTLRHNTGRVLIQIMKEIVRAEGSDERQLRLAHDFRQAASGKPSVVRRMLRRYFLLEMPEEWNQAVFDHHVHDSSTKGRKNPTHLIMDAWVKGIRSLTVIYYHYVRPETARELLEAAEIMGVAVRIGLLFHAPHRGRLIDLIWVPRGFADAEGFLAFLAEPGVQHLMQEGRLASQWMEKHILAMLQLWNDKGRHKLEKELGISTRQLEEMDFLSFVGNSQVFVLHLAEFIHAALFPALKHEAGHIREELADPACGEDKRLELLQRLHKIDDCTPDYLMEVLRQPPFIEEREKLSLAPRLETEEDEANCPELLRTKPLMLLDWISGLHSGNRFVLNLAKLNPEDVLTLLWDCQGFITHLEIFNLKDWQEGKEPCLNEINELQQAINNGSAPRLKQLIHRMLRRCEDTSGLLRDDHDEHLPGMPCPEERAQKLRLILRNIPLLQGFYSKSKIGSRIGTDSSSRPGRWYGMGLAFVETLPYRARREVAESDSPRLRLPLRSELRERRTWNSMNSRHVSWPVRLIRRLPGFHHFLKKPDKEWIPVQEHIEFCNGDACHFEDLSHGNIVTLGSLGNALSNGLSGEEHTEYKPESSHTMNTSVANVLKVLGGFIPAWAAFMLTQDNMLMWLGAPLWFLITGFRNILQAVLGGGGFRRSPLLRWNDYVSWSRLSDSLLYTGISVVLLELMLRSWLLTDIIKLDPVNNELLMFSVISLVNGFYIAGHNYLRGLQTSAIIGNLFRSVFAIPVALAYNAGLETALLLSGTPDPQTIMFSMAAITSKVSSDTVAGIIEGFADSQSNMRLRLWDYKTKLHRVFALHGQLELLFPEQDVSDMLEDPATLLNSLEDKYQPLKTALIANALDLMYFWYYQPRAPHALKKLALELSCEERLALYRSQQVLELEKDVCQLFVDGLVGRDFARALSFYLDRHGDYLKSMRKVLNALQECEG